MVFLGPILGAQDSGLEPATLKLLKEMDRAVSMAGSIAVGGPLKGV